MAAGCDQTDRVFFKQGIGTDLNNGDIVSTTDALNTYVAEVCRQAGLAPDKDSDSCGSRPNDPATWWLFVQAGMNDIDQRCDAYLTWLDYVRRSKEPTLTELAQASTATTVIMDRAGIGAGPIAIAAAAFGFAIQTFTNVTSRLILEVDHSTVQAVVLSHQKQYREELLGSADHKPQVVIPSKPAAIFALRQYLRLCMPMTIETQINTIMTTFSRGGTDALDAGGPMISARTVGAALVITEPAKDTSYTRLRGLLLPNGANVIAPALKDYVENLFKPRTAVGVYLGNAKYVSMRNRISECIEKRAANPDNACKAGSLSDSK